MGKFLGIMKGVLAGPKRVHFLEAWMQQQNLCSMCKAVHDVKVYSLDPRMIGTALK